MSKIEINRRNFIEATVYSAMLLALSGCEFVPPELNKLIEGDLDPAQAADIPIPLIEREAYKSDDFRPIDFDVYQEKVIAEEKISGRDISFESKKISLEYSEFADVAVYDFSDAKSIDELREKLDQELYPFVEAEEREGLKRLELLVTRSVQDKYLEDGVSLAGWHNRNLGFLNFLLAENGLQTRVALGRVVVVDDSIAEGMFFDDDDLHVRADIGNSFLFGTGNYNLPQGYFNRWLVGSDYRENRFYNDEFDISNSFMHEMGHYLLGLTDLYTANEGGGETIYVNDGMHELTPFEIPAFSYPADWLMVLQNAEGEVCKRPVLSPFSAEFLRRFQGSGFSGWEEYLLHWGYLAFSNDVPDITWLELQNSGGEPIIKGRLSCFEAKYEQISQSEFRRFWQLYPDWAHEISLESEGFEPIDGRGCAMSESEMCVPTQPRILMFVIEQEESLHVAYLNSFDLMMVGWDYGVDGPRMVLKMAEIEKNKTG